MPFCTNRIVTQSNPKIQGKFYPLQHEEWLRACRELTPAQRDVLYYIRTIDPYNQGIVINAAEVARQLSGTERIVHRQTVSRALKELDVKGFIDLELLQVRTKVKPKGLWCDDAPEVCGDTNGVMTHPRCDDAPSAIATHHGGSPHTIVDHDAPCAIVTHHAESESLVETESQKSKINKTYLDFLDSLSESEREKFWEFGKNKAAQLPKPPQLPLKWIEAHFEELLEQWEKSQQRTSSTQAHKWENYPQREEWLEKIRQLGPVGFQAEDMPNQKLRREFYLWADANKLIWGQMES